MLEQVDVNCQTGFAVYAKINSPSAAKNRLAFKLIVRHLPKAKRTNNESR
jgi:hypothetical protein